MGVDTGDLDGSGRSGIAITNFDNEMIGLYHVTSPGVFDDISIPSGVGAASRNTLGFGCMFLDVDLDGALDLAVANGHIDETVRNIRGNVGYAQPPQLFLNSGTGKFRDVAGQVGGGFESPKVGRGLAFGDFDRDGDLDILMTTNNGPAHLYRNDLTAKTHSIRFICMVRNPIAMPSAHWCASFAKDNPNRDSCAAAPAIFLNRNCR